MEYEYKRCVKYRNDYSLENKNIKITCLKCMQSKSLILFPYRKNLSFNKDKTCKKCSKENNKYHKNNLTLDKVLQVCLKTSQNSSRTILKKGREECGVNTLKLNDLI